MINSLEMRPSGPVRATIRPPGSKSLTNRALVCAALAEGESTLIGALDSEDTGVMISALRQVGIAVEWMATDDPANKTSLGSSNDARQPTVFRPVTTTPALRVIGCGGRIPIGGVDLYVANSGTTIRFLTAALALGSGTYRLDGTARMRQRPIGDLLQALQGLGARVDSEAGTGCPPVIVRGGGLSGGQTTVAGAISSQFLSALLMAAPYAASDVELLVQGELVSRPYVDMTLAVMASFGVHVVVGAAQQFSVAAGQRYCGGPYEIEPDASAASYFFAAAAITRGEVTVEGLSNRSLQGDIAFCACLERMGCDVKYHPNAITVIGRPLRGIDVDMNAISDTVQTLAAVALFAAGPTVVRGVAHIRHKETDRLAALATELRKLGAEVEERVDGLVITPKKLQPAEIDTYEDHRMAMSMALVGLANPGVVIRDPECTAKTYPRFFRDLENLVQSRP
jgi:3-phosphoshikimate 1-carboxyvinyltransferase